MKGDFSRWKFDASANYSGVLYQQGRVRTDVDDNAQTQIDDHWRKLAGQDIIGGGVAGVPADVSASFSVLSAAVSPAGDVVIQLNPGRIWADGLPLYLPGNAPIANIKATYLAPPLQTPGGKVSEIKDGVRDVVLLDVWEDSISAFQEPLDLLEPALGGPDTTERIRTMAALRLMRLGPNDDCTIVASAADNFDAKGKLTVAPAPAIAIPGDCPVEAGGGYTGFEHYLYRIEIADPDPATNAARFKWSRFNGGLVGRGTFTASAPGTGSVKITANDQMINHCGLPKFYAEALVKDGVFGAWVVVASADATRPTDGTLALTNIQGNWPTAVGTFFRLWDGVKLVSAYPPGSPAVELENGIMLELTPPTADSSNYMPGDYWTFPVRASGPPFDPSLLPTNAPPQGVHHHRVALAEIHWNSAKTASAVAGEIEDCRHIFPPLTKRPGCCTFTVGDGLKSHGDFDSIEAALAQLPDGGEICLLPGTHLTNALIQGRNNIRIHGCHISTKVVPRKGAATKPIFRIVDSIGIVLERMDMVTLGGTAVSVEGSKPGSASDIEIADNRILACQSAISVTNGTGIWIHHNRIRMLDKRGSGVGIYLAADDSQIECNDLRLVPADRMPPLNVPDDPNPIDPNDPCAKLEVVYFNPRIFVQYVEKVWLLPLLVLPLIVQPYRALGGIQIGGGSERVRVVENTIVGGAGNGITLGDGFELPTTSSELPTINVPDRVARIRGQLVGPDGKPVGNAQLIITAQSNGAQTKPPVNANGQFTTSLAFGKYTIDAAAPGLEIDKATLTPVDRPVYNLTIVLRPSTSDQSFSGFLYQIGIEGNDVNAMGRSGIGMPPLRANGDVSSTRMLNAKAVGSALQTRLSFGNPVIGLEIRHNKITSCLKNAFDNTMRAEMALRGLGGISLGLIAEAVIADNAIEANGSSTVPTCGIFVFYGEGVDVTANRIVNNGHLPAATGDYTPPDGRRGGIVLNLMSSFNLLGAGLADTLNIARVTAQTKPRPAARVHENLVDQPVGHALYAVAYGSLSCTDNSFNSELSGLSGFERLAGTVFIFNLVGVQRAPDPVNFKARTVNQTVGANPNANATIAQSTATASASAFARAPAALALLPGGHTMFNDNQSRTGAANTSMTCQTIVSLDDVSYQDNQSRSHARTLFSNAAITGATLRAAGNRLTDAESQTLMSLLSISQLLNDTSLNQGDHCIVAVNMDTPIPVRLGNQVLIPGPCLNLQKIADAVLGKAG